MWGWGATLSYFEKVFIAIILLFRSISELNNIFHAKDLKMFTFNVKLIDGRERRNKKNIGSLNLTQKVNFLEKNHFWLLLSKSA